MAAGFSGIRDNVTFSHTFLPCPVGTFSNFSSKGAEGCIQCPPGMSQGLLMQFIYVNEIALSN